MSLLSFFTKPPPRRRTSTFGGFGGVYSEGSTETAERRAGAPVTVTVEVL